MDADSVAKRLTAGAKANESTGCLEWQGGLIAGYGCIRVKVNGKWKSMLAHRVAYLLAQGEPGGMLVCHKCDNRRCINPDHLFLGTYQDNMDDMKAKKRSAGRGAGTKNNRAKLTEQQVIGIRKLKAFGISGAAIARSLGMSKGQINNLSRGDTWKHLRFSQQ